ncbi:uncharacterized protein Aud_009653 [Aspergillus udagawae]|uniref:Uncharacterized protein n=1 Tax=Aspergillus udagawae TaxID=91492 RepID=A0A8E0R1Z3_9EURO|nr:uncharacterized protein Aud_009653 [Aspergillus udagawae]GIC93171.1 hypothetical protein Aud_009653 [Aspergillus udagawae]
MIENILANVTGGVSLPVEYPAAASQNTTSGEKFVVDTNAHGLRHCPHQKYALFGYSQGATLILKVLRQLSPSALESVKSVVLVGNPYRLPGKISNVDATAQHDERASVGMFAEEAIADNKPIPQLSKDMDQSGKVLDYCLADDFVCSPNPACSCQIPAGHLSYGLVDTVQPTAFEHAVGRLGSISK